MKITKEYLKKVIKEAINEAKQEELAEIAQQISMIPGMPPEDRQGFAQGIARELESVGFAGTADLLRAGKYNAALAKLNRSIGLA